MRTIKELIEQLQKMDQTFEIICMDEYENEFEVTDIFSYTTVFDNQTIICITRS